MSRIRSEGSGTLPCRLLALAAAAAAAMQVSPVRAQSAAAQPAEADAQTVVVTGSVRAQQVLDAPFAIGVVDAQSLREAGPMINLSEAMARVPGLNVANRNNYAQDLQISSRGFGARASFGVRGLRLYTDGIPATGPDGQGQVAHFDLAGAARIEVLRGPFSVLYGNSSGGVIALFGAPATEGRVEVGADAGNYGLRQGRVALAAPLGGGFDLRANVSSMQIDGFRPQSAAERDLGNVRLGWRGDADTVTVLASDHQQEAQDPLGLNRTQFNANPLQTTSQATQFNTRKTISQNQAGVNWRHRFGGEQGLTETSLSLYQGQRSVTQWQSIPVAVQANPAHGGGVIDFDRDYGGLELRANFRLGSTELVAGLVQDRQRDDRRGYENFIVSGTTTTLGVTGALRRDEIDRADTRDVFVQAEAPLAQDFSATAGLRSGRMNVSVEDHYLSNGDDSGTLSYRYTNPVVGLRWRLQPGWALHASLARGYESPTLGELAYRPDGTSGLNTALLGQTSRQFEIGSKWRGTDFEVDAALFLVDTNNEIGVATSAGGRSSFQNVGHTRRYGLELSGQRRWSPVFRTGASVSLLSAKYLDSFTSPAGTVPAGNRIAGTQNASAFAEAAWQPAPGTEFALEWRAQGSTPVNDLNSDFAAGYAIFNVRLSQRISLGGAGDLEALVRFDNINDRRYAGSVIVNDANGRYFETASPNSVLISLRWSKKF